MRCSRLGKLFFYSDQIIGSSGNKRLDHLLFANMRTSRIKIGYIPSTEDKEKAYFNMKVHYYREYGIRNIMFFDLYSEFNSSKMNELLECEIIHLSAGNPIEFKKAIQHRKMGKVLLKYFNNGGTIVGVSGGAVQLGKSTNLFQLFVGETYNDLATLNLVDFEFLPHYNRWDDDFKRAVYHYSKTTGTTVYAGSDGDGIIVEGGDIQIIGDVIKISG